MLFYSLAHGILASLVSIRMETQHYPSLPMVSLSFALFCIIFALRKFHVNLIFHPVFLGYKDCRYWRVAIIIEELRARSTPAEHRG